MWANLHGTEWPNDRHISFHAAATGTHQKVGLDWVYNFFQRGLLSKNVYKCKIVSFLGLFNYPFQNDISRDLETF